MLKSSELNNSFQTLLKCQNVGFSYQLGNKHVIALKDVTLDLPQGSLIGLAGPSGSGKSTLLSLLGLIEPLQQGQITYLDHSFSTLSEAQKNQLRREQFGFVFQQFLLFDTLTAVENVSYFMKHLPLSAEEKKARATQCLLQVGLKDHLNKKPLEMSGGQRQRVAIARALVKKPRIIIADEPTASLDQETGKQVMSLLRGIVEDHQATVILASHDLMALSYTHQMVRLQDGVARMEVTAPQNQEVLCPL